ncbi:MAG: hypothetical protein IJI33_09335 [Solobacterium sp.]|nr:hypothetical protein [Solobacterium sp.]
MKGVLIMTALAALLCSCAGKRDKPPSGLANPWKEVDGPEAAASEAGFEITVPEQIEGYGAPVYRVTENMIEVLYQAGEDRLVIRKAPLTRTEGVKDNIAGDYSKYEEFRIIDGIDFCLETRGNTGLINNAVWDDGTMNYAVIVNPGTSHGLELSVIMELMKAVK